MDSVFCYFTCGSVCGLRAPRWLYATLPYAVPHLHFVRVLALHFFHQLRVLRFALQHYRFARGTTDAQFIFRVLFVRGGTLTTLCLVLYYTFCPTCLHTTCSVSRYGDLCILYYIRDGATLWQHHWMDYYATRAFTFLRVRPLHVWTFFFIFIWFALVRLAAPRYLPTAAHFSFRLRAHTASAHLPHLAVNGNLTYCAFHYLVGYGSFARRATFAAHGSCSQLPHLPLPYRARFG